MSDESDRTLRQRLGEHTVFLSNTQNARDAVAARDREFLRQYTDHLTNVIGPTLKRLEKIVREYGHDLLIEHAIGNENSATGSILATLLLSGVRSDVQERLSAIGILRELRLSNDRYIRKRSHTL